MYKDSNKAHIKNNADYLKSYECSISDKDSFWEQVANRISWFKKWDIVSNIDYKKAHIKWFEGAKLNVSYNCLDRHVENGFGNNIALIWEGNDPSEDKTFTYSELLEQVSKFSNALKKMNVKKGDRVCIYMQMIPELTIAMLACARIGAIHSIVFGAFSSDSLSDRINDSECKIVITQDTGVRGVKTDIPMKSNVDKALSSCPSVDNVIVVNRTGATISMNQKRDVWWLDIIKEISSYCKPEIMDAEDPLFILYTSGSTGKPKGV